MNTTPSPTLYASPRRKRRGWIGTLVIIGLIAFAVLLVLAIASPFVAIPAGYTGVVTTFGNVENYTLSAGFHLKSPWQQVVLMDNREQKKTSTLSAFSKDIQQVNVVATVIFRVDSATAQKLYMNVGVDYYNQIMDSRIKENTKAVFTKYSAESLMEVRSGLSGQVKELLEPEMKAYGISISSISIEDIDFTDAFTDAVEAKQVAEQTKLKVETEQAQQVSMEKSAAERRKIAANADAQQREILAKADAEVAKIQADAKAYSVNVQADAEAASNAKIAASITDKLIEYRQVSQWDGKLPEIFAGDGALPILDVTKAQQMTQ